MDQDARKFSRSRNSLHNYLIKIKLTVNSSLKWKNAYILESIVIQYKKTIFQNIYLKNEYDSALHGKKYWKNPFLIF